MRKGNVVFLDFVDKSRDCLVTRVGLADPYDLGEEYRGAKS